jgi:hypothetical protein
MALSISGRAIPSNIPNTSPTSLIQVGIDGQSGNTLSAGDVSAQRVMQQISAPNWDYQFSVPPGQVNHEGYGINLNEIARPYLTPLIDVTGGKALRASFEFPIIARQLSNTQLLDGYATSVDREILSLQEFANYGIPVQFQNMHPALSTPTWYIDNITFNHSRIGLTGETAQALCQISLIEFISKSTKMILLPRFSYGKFTPIQKKGSSTGTGGGIDEVAAQKALSEATAAAARARREKAAAGATGTTGNIFGVFDR